MSQEDVYRILKELGGMATSAEIKARAKEKFPDRTLFLYVGNRLRKLETKKVVKAVRREGRSYLWKIVGNL